MRRRAQTIVIPEDLLTYHPQRWVRAATDADDPYVRHIPPAQRATNWYVLAVVAPFHYRAALLAAVGRRVADRHFYSLRPAPGHPPVRPSQ